MRDAGGRNSDPGIVTVPPVIGSDRAGIVTGNGPVRIVAGTVTDVEVTVKVVDAGTKFPNGLGANGWHALSVLKMDGPRPSSSSCFNTLDGFCASNPPVVTRATTSAIRIDPPQ